MRPSSLGPTRPPFPFETTGSASGPRPGRLRRIPDTMTAVPAVLLGGALAVGVAPGFGPDVVAHAGNEAGSGGAVVAFVHRTPVGILLGLAAAAPAMGLAAAAVTRPALLAVPGRAQPLRRPRSGHAGDYPARVPVGTTMLGALALPGMRSA
ncbi:hypothetical protein [Streptomyces sp. NPDC058678]|uniref:hypothetical protein n=1 Tax=Streptomyces sp. NPDC058678 TaxID=3346595 RepID=UPI00365C1DA0